MRYRRLLFTTATPALSWTTVLPPSTSKRSFALTSGWRRYDRPMAAAEPFLISGSSTRSKFSKLPFYCRATNINSSSGNAIWRGTTNGGRNNRVSSLCKRNMSSNSCDGATTQQQQQQPSSKPPQTQQQLYDDNINSNEAEKITNQQQHGSRTKFARRERRNVDKRTNNARVRHSYLKLILKDGALDELHDLVCQVQREWDENENIYANVDSKNISGEEEDSQHPQQTQKQRPAIRSKKQSKRRLSIKPRSRTSLHMTCFFTGQVLSEMPIKELQNWEYTVRECVAEHTKNNIEASFSSNDAYSLRFTKLMTFPPRRNNLIVAVFETSEALDDLYRELCRLAMMEKQERRGHEGNVADGDINADSDGDDTIAVNATPTEGGEKKEYEFPLLRSLTLKQNKQRRQRDGDESPSWIAHVTLGNLAGGTKEDVRRLSEWLETRNYKQDDAAVDLGTTDVITGNEGTSLPASSTQPLPSTSDSISEKVPLIESEDRTGILESDIHILGLTLGGPIPEHGVDIDWNFPFTL